MRVDLAPDAARAAYRYVDTITSPASSVRTAAAFTVPIDEPGAVPA